MKTRIFTIILIFVFILIIRYIGIYVAIDSGNMVLLQVTSFCNPLINAKPVTTYIPFQIISDAAPFGRPPLAYACSDFWREPTKYELDTIRILLENGANPNVDKGAPLKWGLRHRGENRFKIVKLLFDYGGKYNDSNLYLAELLSEDGSLINKDRYDLFIKWMQENDFQTYENGYYNYYDLITNAIYGNSYQELKYIFENYNVNVNYIDNDFIYSYLEYAVVKKRVEIFKLLIDYGADVNYINSKGKTLDDMIVTEVDDYEIKDRMLKILEVARSNAPNDTTS